MNALQITLCLIFTVAFLVFIFSYLRVKVSIKTGGERYTRIRVKGGRRQVYDSEVSDWIFLDLISGGLDFDEDIYNDELSISGGISSSTYTSDYGSSYSSDYSSSDSSSSD